ncbi:glycoside hydrolase family 3 protein [Sistotremastrum suecicum HHB10207 ss-3]|uniref:Glycoside hydrolase family 3 protein n=1 Tax=Sistotremastrum suecicum HHB10207 ss-3 TaxID=1314776 RepID=A0A166CQ86_9AGAM|nr:glycoside hydrolase family 3 protein [Sistotremastrum suecicum HHB10207 ss-3]
MELTEPQRKEIGQHFVLGFHGTEISEEALSLIRTYYVGNVIIMRRNVSSLDQLQKLILQLQSAAKTSGHDQPLMIGIDQENGLVSAFSSTHTKTAGTQFPGAMALAATGSLETAQSMTRATAQEMAMCGINWAYSPVADVNSNPLNPVIGVRSFGDDPIKVGHFARAVSDALTESGVAPCAKHFPGHGDTSVDSHHGLPVIDKTLVELESNELVPFRTLVDGKEPVASVMTAHIAMPKALGNDIPASMSSSNIRLLRETLGYDGIIVTDCLEMGAIVDNYGTPKGALESLIAGTDIAMICHTYSRQVDSITATYEAVIDGRLDLAQLDISGRRIRQFKRRFARNWETVLSKKELPSQALLEKHARLSEETYTRAITLLSDPKKTLPLPINSSILLLTPTIQSLNPAVDDQGVLKTKDGVLRNTAGPSYLAMASAASAYCQLNHAVYSKDIIINEESFRDVSAVIFVTRNANQSDWQIKVLQKLMHSLPYDTKVVVLASCGPYDLQASHDIRQRVAYLAAYEFTKPALEAAVGVIFGDHEAQGSLPVQLWDDDVRSASS